MKAEEVKTQPTDLRIHIRYEATGSPVEEKSSVMPSLPVPNSTKSFWHMTHPSDLVNHRTTPQVPNKAKVVIIGSGISGAFAARELTRLGITDILVLEAREICSGATGRNGGHCQAIVYDQLPDVSDFEIENFRRLSELVEQSNVPCDFFKFKEGGCHAFYSSDVLDEIKTKILDLKRDFPHLGKQVRIIEDKAELALLKIPTAAGAVVQANAAGLHPYKLVTWVWKELLRSSNINIQTGTPVTFIDRNDDEWIVNTPRGWIYTPQVLLTTNAYTARLLPEFNSLIVPVQGEMSALKPPKAVLESPLQHDYSFMGLIQKDTEQDDYLVQRPIEAGGHLMFGGGRIVAKEGAIGVSDDSFVDPEVALYLRRMIPLLMDVGDGEMAKTPDRWADVERESTEEMTALAEWTGIMGFSRDGHPWVGAVPGRPGIWLCGGYTGHGMPNASLSATHVANLVTAFNKGKDWRLVEEEAVASKKIPRCYVLNEGRMARARQLPEVRSKVA